MTFEQIDNKVAEWAEGHGLISQDSQFQQMCKGTEEWGELNAAILKQQRAKELDSFGDVIVTIAILARIRNVSLTQCFEAAYNEIKNREVKMVNGSLVKKEDQ